MLPSLFCPDCAGEGKVIFNQGDYWLLIDCQLCLANHIGNQYITVKDLETRRGFLFLAEKDPLYWIWLRAMAPSICEQYKRDKAKVIEILKRKILEIAETAKTSKSKPKRKKRSAKKK